jgi:hypothetical protein
MPKGDPRVGDYEALVEQMKLDEIQLGDLSSLSAAKLKQYHTLAYNVGGSGKKPDYVSRLDALIGHGRALEAQAKEDGETACFKFFRDFRGTTSYAAKGVCSCGITHFLMISLNAESPQVRTQFGFTAAFSCLVGCVSFWFVEGHYFRLKHIQRSLGSGFVLQKVLSPSVSFLFDDFLVRSVRQTLPASIEFVPKFKASILHVNLFLPV